MQLLAEDSEMLSFALYDLRDRVDRLKGWTVRGWRMRLIDNSKEARRFTLAGFSWDQSPVIP